MIWNWSQLEGMTSNMGDKAILEGMICTLREYKSDIRITLFSSDPKYTAEQYSVEAIPLANTLKGLYMAVKVLRQTDLIILGGGELIQDRSCFLYIPFNLYIGLIAKIFGKQVMCYSIGVSNKEEISRIGRFFTRVLLNKVDIITVRDVSSKKILRSIGVRNPPIYVTADASVGMVFEWTKKTMLGKVEGKLDPLIIISPRCAVFFTPSSILNILPMSLRLKYNLLPREFYVGYERVRNTIGRIADGLIRKLNAKIIFTPMYSGHKFSYRDDKFCFDIIKSMKYKSNTEVILVRTPQELIKILAKADIILSVPLHTTILGSLVGTPSIAISYGSKIKRTMKLLGQEDNVFDIKKFGHEEIMERIKKVLQCREEIKRELKFKAINLRERYLHNTKRALKLLGV